MGEGHTGRAASYADILGAVSSRPPKCALITIPGEPVAFARPRPHFNRPGVFIHPRKYRNWLEDARKQIVSTPIPGPVAVEVVAIFPRPSSWPKAMPIRLLFRPSIPDVDNILKAGLDACSGRLFEDDAKVVRCTGVKLYSKNRSCSLMIHVAQVSTVSVPWNLSFTPCHCWQELPADSLGFR